MSDPGLERVIAQYFDGPISSRALPSAYVDGALGKSFFKDQAEALVQRLFGDGVLGDVAPASTVVCLMLPPGVVLVDGNSDGEQREAPHARSVFSRRRAGRLKARTGRLPRFRPVLGTTVYYAVSVYSDGDNGIVAFDEPWKSVVATFYHELCEARTDPDVEDVMRTGDAGRLG